MGEDNISNNEDNTIFFKPQPVGHTESLAGKSLGEFEIIREIARGGMGYVYEGFQKNLNRKVAVKVLPKYLSDQKNFADNFHKEAEILASLSNPNIVPIFNYGVVNGIYYFAMEYVEGTPLSAVLAKQTASNSLVPQVDAIHIMKQVAAGLAYAHNKGIVHKDVKPGNILIDNSGLARIADFGLVKFGELAGDRGRQIAGTPPYMSPEQMQGKEIDHRSDIYSLGCVFYELLTGATPFREKSLKELLSKVLNEQPIPPSKMAPDIPILLDQIVLRMLKTNPEERFQSMDEFSNILERYQKGLLSIFLEGQAKPVNKKIFVRVLIFIICIIPLAAILYLYLSRVKEIRYDRWAQTRMTIADNFRANNMNGQALKIYEEIVKKAPAGRWGAEAKKKIEELR